MLDIFVYGKTLPEAYHKALTALYGSENGEISLTMKVFEPFAEPRISRCWFGGPRDLEQYRQELLDGILDFEVEEGLWHYTYHQRFSKWIPGVIEELKRDPNSRRAAISVRDNTEDEGNENPACLQHIQFMIRDGKLDMYVLFRSNDGPRASFMNAFGLTELQKYVADELGVKVGSYTHRANNYHVYPESMEQLSQYVFRILGEKEVAYNYTGDWDKLMESEREAIAKTVADQKRKAGVE